MKSLNEIKEEYNKINFDDKVSIENFISNNSSDERTGAINQVEKAKKKLVLLDEEILRTEKMYSFERKYYDLGAEYICGIDEVGRGPFAGPVVACACILPKDHKLLYLNDSKQVSKKKREELFDILKEEAVSYGIGVVSWERIDEINILQATYEAMREAVGKLAVVPDIMLNDAVNIPGIPIKQIPIVKGDTLSASIAAASILAKVTRDRMMEAYDEEYPGYYFAENAGYGVQKHIEALKKLGPCPIHRKTFIKKYISDTQ